MTTLVVAETFGPTVQGEGPHTGRRCGFIRLGACNLACSWCDTPYTWDATRYDLRAELTRVDVDELVARVTAMDVPLVVLTGGEPLLQQGTDLAAFLIAMHRQGVEVHVETNGTIAPIDSTAALVSHYSVSPKLANAGMTEAKRIRPAALGWFASRAARHGDVAFKFVATSRADLDEIQGIVDAHAIPSTSVWVMGEGQEPQDNTRSLMRVAEASIALGWNVTPRLHTLLWGATRGV